jgi:glycosyltransferase involved in cell wall biosynthesis
MVITFLILFYKTKPSMEESRLTEPSLDFYLLIPYYDNLQGLIRSIQSVRYDTTRYSFLIIDDGSSERLQFSDLEPYLPAGPAGRPPVTIINLPKNGGITKALNAGLHWLGRRNDFRFVARLDCGDLCAPDRFARQVEFLDRHQEIDLVGSWCIFSNSASGSSFQYKTPTEHKKIARGMYFRNIFIHPTVMWRASVAQQTAAYPEKYPFAEDYGFFYEIISKGQAAVLPETLVICEINPEGLSIKFRKQHLKSRGKVVMAYGRNKVLSIIGVLKLWMLGVIPYKWVRQVKQWSYGIHFRPSYEG